MWKAVSYVTSGLTLAAFIAAIIASMYRRWLLQRQQLISSVPEFERAPLVDKTIEFFNIDTSGLSPTEKYKLALIQIEERAKRFKIVAVVIVIIAVLAAGATALATLQPSHSDEIQYSGRVSDVNSQQIIQGAKVSVEGQGTPQVYYTDSEGVFSLKLQRGSAESVRIRVEATGYQLFDRNVTVSGSRVEDIRLTPSSLVQLPRYAWSQRAVVYHYNSCCWVNRISPENLQRGDIPPEGRRLHEGCPTKAINGRCGNETL